MNVFMFSYFRYEYQNKNVYTGLQMTILSAPADLFVSFPGAFPESFYAPAVCPQYLVPSCVPSRPQHQFHHQLRPRQIHQQDLQLHLQPRCRIRGQFHNNPLSTGNSLRTFALRRRFYVILIKCKQTYKHYQNL